MKKAMKTTKERKKEKKRFSFEIWIKAINVIFVCSKRENNKTNSK